MRSCNRACSSSSRSSCSNANTRSRKSSSSIIEDISVQCDRRDDEIVVFLVFLFLF